MDALASVMKKAFQRLTFIDSKVWIEFLLECLNGKAVELDRDGMDMLNMLLYTVYQIPEISSLELLERIKASEEIKNELIELLEYRLTQIDFVSERVKGTVLCLHCSYTKDQILSGLGYLNASSVRQGVFYVSERKIDAFFVTIDKAEEDFSPSTRYDDYAIDSSTFHWQSQNATSSSSPTGQRYINHRSLGSDVFLFVRKEKEKPGFIANPYVFLGSAEYVPHRLQAYVYNLEAGEEDSC